MTTITRKASCLMAILGIAALGAANANAQGSLRQEGFDLVINLKTDQTMFVDNLVCDNDPNQTNVLVNCDGLGYYPTQDEQRLSADFVDWGKVIPGETYTLTMHKAGPDMTPYYLKVKLNYTVKNMTASTTHNQSGNYYYLTLPEGAGQEPMIVYWGDPQNPVSYIYNKNGKTMQTYYVSKYRKDNGTLHNDEVTDNTIMHQYADAGLHTVTLLVQ